MKKAIYIIESANTRLDVLNESEENKTKKGVLLSLEGVFGQIDVYNRNGRKYQRENYSEMIEKINQRIISEGGVLGQLEHPENLGIDLTKVSHIIDTPLRIEEHTGLIKGGISLLNNEYGRQALSIVEAGLPLYISSRGRGSIDEQGVVWLDEMPTYDLVGTPGFANAALTKVSKAKFNEEICENAGFIYLNGNDAFNKLLFEKKADKKENMKDDKQKDPESEEKDLEDKIKQLESEITALKNSNKEAKEEDMKEIKESIQTLIQDATSTEITNLKNEVNESINTIKSYLVKGISEGVEEHINTEIVKGISEGVEEHLKTEIAKVQQWVVETYSRGIQDFINLAITEKLEQYADINESWIKEHFLPMLNGYLNESFKPEIVKLLNENKVTDQSNVVVNKSEKTTNESIFKKVLSNATKKIEEAYKDLDNGQPLWIRYMPENKKALYESLTDEQKSLLVKKAERSIVNTPASIEVFWSNINESQFDITKDTTKLNDIITENYNNVEKAGLLGALKDIKIIL